jgi:AcrR family transcriptional regulator
MRDKRPTRLKIHQAALHLFVHQGISETSVRDLAQAAGIAEGTLYRHYVSKDALIADLFLINYHALAEQISQRQATLPTTAPFAQRLETLFNQVFTFYDQDPTLFRFLLLVQHHALPRVQDGPSNPVTILHTLLIQAMDRGEVPRQDPAVLGAIVLGMVVQPAIAVLYDRLRPPLAPLAAHMASACLRALRPPDPVSPSPFIVTAGSNHHD